MVTRGYGNAMNVPLTVEGFAKAGCAGLLSADQLASKRYGHTPCKDVVIRDEAFDRIEVAVDARQEETDILIIGRTDANHTHELEEVIHCGKRYKEIGADIIFIEPPNTVEEM